jgi:hypothetical protein
VLKPMRNPPVESVSRSRSRCTWAVLVLALGVALSIYVTLSIYGTLRKRTSHAHLTGSLAETNALAGDPVRPGAPSRSAETSRFDLQPPSAAPQLPPGAQPVAGAGALSNGLGEVSSELASELNEEQRAILREHRLAELGQLVAAAHNRNEIAHEDERAQTQHAYLTLLSLWMKVHRQEGLDRSAELLQREAEFYRALPAEQMRLFHLPISAEERREKLDEFRAQFFARFGDAERSTP